jgi:DNA-binding transcriptional LysR family regulator
MYLAASATMGNFSRAAESLGVNTSTISRRVGLFEDELGLAVFERGHAGVRLTTGGRTVLLHIRRALGELEAVKSAGRESGSGVVGEVRLGVRLPLIGEPIRGLLVGWAQSCPNVVLTVSEMNERDLAIALDERRVDVVLAPDNALSRRPAALALYRERLFAALPHDHALVPRESLTWAALSKETVLVQGWEESQAEREFFTSLLGTGTDFRSHAASKLSLLTLVDAGFGITLVTQNEAHPNVPGLIFRPVDEPDAVLQLDLSWLPEAEDPAVGRFVAFMRDAARSRRLL